MFRKQWVWSVAASWLACTGGCQTYQGLKADIAGIASPSPKDSTSVGKFAFKSEPEIRVRIRGGVSTIEVAGPSQLVVRPAGGAKGKPEVVRSPATVTTSDRGVTVVHGAGTTTLPFGTDVEIGPSGESTESLRVDTKRYPGFVTVRPRWSNAPTTFDVAITMPIESYLPGVLAGELWKDWPRQTFEAQAIAARTYALHERSRARSEGRPYDVEDSTNDQVFTGSTAASMPNEAARATRGLVLVSEDRLLRAYYSSTCGGRAASAAAVWKTTSGYEFNTAKPLQGQPRQHFCQNSKWYRWEAVRSDDDVNRRLRAWGKQFDHEIAGLGRLRSADVVESNAAKRPNRFKVTDDKGKTFTLTAEELRMGLNQNVPGMTPVPADAIVRSGDLEISVWATQVTIRGRGWGHGVGMCQWCAKGMADAGLDWASMIKDFYPGAEVVKAY